MGLFYRKLGKGDKNLVIVHGLYGSSDNWLTVARQLMDLYQVYIVDQRNHGQSPHSNMMDYDVMAEDLKEFMSEAQIKSANLMGHSMGGKTAMCFALKYPDMVDKLIVVDIAPKPYGSNGNYAHITNDHKNIVKALLSVNPKEHTSRSSIDKFLKDKITNDMVRSFLLKNISRDKDGLLQWKLNISAIAENLDFIMDGFSGRDELYGEEKEVFFIRGANSAYILEEDMQNVRKFFPSAQLTTIPNAGHWLHAEQTELFIKSVRYFLD